MSTPAIDVNPATETDPVIEFDELMDRCLGNLDLMERAIEAFIGQFPNDLANVGRAIEVGSKAEIAAIAHRMKGSASNIGATAIASELKRLELAANGNKLRDAAHRYEALRGEWSRLLHAIG